MPKIKEEQEEQKEYGPSLSIIFVRAYIFANLVNFNYNLKLKIALLTKENFWLGN